MSSLLNSPSRTPSRSENVERLLTLQKSTKHLSDADVLSFAAEASAIKRATKPTHNNENNHPNSRPVSKRLFDIDHCSKSAIGSYSPELSQQRNWSGTEQHEAEGGNEYGEEESDEDSRADEIAVENSVNRILQIVDSSVKKRLAGQAGRKTASVSTSSASAGVLTPSSAGPGQEEGEQEEANFADEDYGTDLAANADQDDAEWTREGSSNGGGIRDMVVARVLSILHTGTYKEVLSLHGIGQVRALRILTARDPYPNPSAVIGRDAGDTPFAVLQELLQEVGMLDKQIERLLRSNAAAFVDA